MAFFDFDFIENFFFISLGITFALIVLLVYHFKQRITSMERKGDTMYELITNVVKELQFMKKLNAYYETLFQNTALSVDENPVKENANNEGVVDQRVGNGLVSKDSVLVKDSVVSTTNNIVMNLIDPQPQPTESHIHSRIVVSEDESSVSDEGEESDSDSDETDLNYSTTDDDSEDEYNEKDENPEEPENEEPITTLNQPEIVGIEEDLSSSNENDESAQQFTFCEAKTPNVVSSGIPQFTFCEAKTPNVVADVACPGGIPQSPIEMNHLMEMIQKAFTTGIAREEPQKFAPYYEDEMGQPNTYKPVILHNEELLEDEPIVDVLLSGEDFSSKVIESDMVELDISGLEDFSQQPEQFTFCEAKTPNVVADFVSPGIPQISSKENVLENIVEPILSPVQAIDKKQTREVYRKMNITQLRGIATATGITVDTTKMKKNELIQLLENLEE